MQQESCVQAKLNQKVQETEKVGKRSGGKGEESPEITKSQMFKLYCSVMCESCKVMSYHHQANQQGKEKIKMKRDDRHAERLHKMRRFSCLSEP